MMPTTELSTSPENTILHPFRQTVLAGQNEWRKLRKEPQWRNRIAVEIPEERSKRVLEWVIANLPPYIDEATREELLISHPPPLVNLTPTYDKRCLAPCPSNIEINWHLPEQIVDSESASLRWADGISALDELANYYTIDHMSKSMVADGRDGIALLLAGYNGIQKKLEQANNIIISTVTDYKVFQKHMVQARFSGDLSMVNEDLVHYGYSVDNLALEIGNIYGIETLSDHAKKLPSYISAYVTKFPGVIMFSLKFLAPFALVGAGHHLFTHEVLHYLAHDQDHLELISGSTRLKDPA